MSTTAFSSDGEVAIHRHTDVDKTHSQPLDATQLNSVYENDRCAKWITDHSFKTVALQLPDELLKDAAALVGCLKTQVNAELVVLADTSYGSCCVDEVAAQHYNADAIIHYGASCLSPTRRLPVLYVFCGQSLDLQHCCEYCQALIDTDTPLVLVCDVMYHGAIDAVSTLLKTAFPKLIVSSLAKTDEGISDETTLDSFQSRNCIKKLGRTIALPKGHNIEDYSILYIGSENLFLTNLIYTFNKCKFYSYNPTTKEARQETLNTNKMLMKRYYMVEKAKDARIVGILVGTLGVANYLEVIARLKSLISLAGKKSYTFVVGKLNVAKLANFAEVDVFVLVACPLNTMFDSTEFYQPVVTPYEMELACNPSREWTGDYVTDFRELLPGGACHVDLPDTPQEPHTDLSLITGGLRRMGAEQGDQGPTGGAVVKRDDVMIVANTAGEYLSGRSWQGLEPKLGQTPVTKAVQGTRGIAMGYEHEPHMADT